MISVAFPIQTVTSVTALKTKEKIGLKPSPGGAGLTAKKPFKNNTVTEVTVWFRRPTEIQLFSSHESDTTQQER
ncbi:hypothetical protein [Ruegeria atlantica]|uniref:Uncharacterized protein n=1 Tax=Ruegeria atlantica TaxID=81569 RepID=A0A0P1E4H8_9RHOB|nr:hypothetical protein [Ruegeria atlantica]CUH42059.1 hypothetical protein RUM4293_00944 [Ruegeria atlantica]